MPSLTARLEYLRLHTRPLFSIARVDIAPTWLPTDPHPLGQPSTFIRPLAMTQFGNTTQIQLLRVHFLIPTYHRDPIWCSSSCTDSYPPIPIYDLPTLYSVGTNADVASHAMTSIEISMCMTSPSSSIHTVSPTDHDRPMKMPCDPETAITASASNSRDLITDTCERFPVNFL